MYKRNGKGMSRKKKPAGKMSKTSGQKNAGKEEDSGNLEFTMETGKSISAISRRVAAMSNEGWRPLGGAFFFYTDNGAPAFAQSLTRRGVSKIELEYLIQTGKSPSALASRVNLKIGEGLYPVGSGFVFRSDDGTLIYCQTMIQE